MPSESKRQHAFMEAVSHDPAFAKRAGVPQSVGRDFVIADIGRSLSNLPKKAPQRKRGRK